MQKIIKQISPKFCQEEDVMGVQSFQINVPQAMLDDLQARLARTRWPGEVEGVGWDYGTNLGYMKELADYWQHKYDWRKHEAELNRFAHFPSEAPLPREWAERNVNLRRFTEMPRGGHFAALEEPELFANDLREALRQIRK